MANQKRKKKLRMREARRANAFSRQRDTGLSRVDGGHGYQVLTFEVTFDRLTEPKYDRLPNHVQDLSDLLFLSLERSPEEAIPRLEDLCEQYPDIPVFRNHLSAAYHHAGRDADAVHEMIDCYEEFPDYLFGRITLALYCVQAGEHERVGEILDHKFDLQELCPGRKRFHVTEVVGFYGLMGLYHLAHGDVENAESCYDILATVDADNQMTRLLAYRLAARKTPLFGRLIARALSLRHDRLLRK